MISLVSRIVQKMIMSNNCVCVLLIDNWNFLFSLYNSVSSVSVFLHLFVCVCVLKRYAKLFNFLYIRKYKRYLIYWFSFSLSGIQKVFFLNFQMNWNWNRKWKNIFWLSSSIFFSCLLCVCVCYGNEMKSLINRRLRVDD